MANKRRVALLAAGGLVVLLALVAGVLVHFVDVNAYKPRLEAAASTALGMDVRIGGRLRIGLFPAVQVTLEDVRIRNRGTDVASAQEASLEIELLPLFRRTVRVVKIGMQRPRISLERDRDGKFNFEQPEGEARKTPVAEAAAMRLAPDGAHVSLADGTLAYTDKQTGEGFEAEDVTLEVRNLRLVAGGSPDLLKRLAFTAEIACKVLRTGSLAVSNLTFGIEGEAGRFGMRPLTADRLVYSGPGGKVTADRLTLGVENLTVGGDGQADPLRRIAFAGTAGIKEIRTEALAVSDVKFAVAGKDGVFDLTAVTMRLFGGHGAGNVRATLSGSVPRYDVQYSLSQFRIEEFFKTLSPKQVAEGAMDFSATLSMRGTTATEMKRTAEGKVSLRGENLTLDGVDLDRVVSRYEASQNFNLVDVSAFFFAGPLAPLLTKGYNFATLYQGNQGTGGSSRIGTLVSDWKVERGVARAQDVAMATNENRIALRGSLDVANERFDEVTVAVVDGKGCAKAHQTIRGPFRKPEVEQVSVLQTVAGPVLTLFRQAKKLFGGQCEAFYTGSLAPPK